MINQQLLDYINTQLQRGVSEAEIKQSLIANGWNQADVEAALGSRNTAPDSPTVPPPSQLSQEEALSSVKRIGRFRASWTLFRQSWRLLQQDKEIVLFPILSSLASTIATVLFGLGLWLSGIINAEGEASTLQNEAIFYGVLLIFYVIIYFIITFFKVGLTAVVYERINGRNIDFKTGISRANSIRGKIFTWSLIAATVGVVLRIISDRSKWLGKLVAGLLGAAWNIVTMFIAPTLLLDNVSVWQSIKNSGTIFKKTWGETLIVNVSMGLAVFIIQLGVMALFGVLLYGAITFGLHPVSYIVLGVLFVLVMIIISVIYTSLNEIFKVALYSYARFGIIAEGFSPELIVGAARQKK